MDYKESFKHLFSKEPNLRIDVYYYDGQHKYEDQTEGLKLAMPYLSEKCVILVDDINWESVEKANTQFLRKNPDFKSVFKIKTTVNRLTDWWNGFQVITRGI
ncbi:MAG: class I SAM-dependent methyltransferase [Candidatus Omnitrophica bacterium]|nr:class I SAM-dependent methyltransferase [Candidatus Omnitrophota bacterium]